MAVTYRLSDVPRPPAVKMTLGDKLHRLARISPQDVTDLEQIVDWLLAKRWPWPRNPWKKSGAA